MTARIITLVFSFLLLLNISTSLANAQSESYGVAVPLINLATPVEEGSLVCLDSTGYKACDFAYDSALVGVATREPSTAVSIDDIGAEFYLLNSGLARIKVSTENGDILTGDLVTTSSDPGIGQKATRNGYVLGIATEDFNPGDDLILVSVNIHSSVAFADSRSNLFELLRTGVSAPVLTPLSALRYILAAGVTVVSFLLGFIYFGRLAHAGVEAIGRNPLAHRTIELTVLLHIVITVAIFVAGLVIAYLILAL